VSIALSINAMAWISRSGSPELPEPWGEVLHQGEPPEAVERSGRGLIDQR
jgi:hypothetical protein